MHPISRRNWQALLSLFALCLLSVVSFGQVSTAGKLTGSVTDSAGAVVPNAQLTIKNIATQTQFTVISDKEGGWLVPSVPSGAYNISVTAKGFKTTVMQGVNVDVGQPTTVNVTLETGGVDEQVVITGGGEVLQTQSATISSTITGRQISELPFSTRDAMQLVLVLPGTQTPGTPRSSSINGLPKGSLNITIDGINVQDNLLKSSDGFFTATQAKADAVSEVSLSTATPGAESGGQGAAQVRFTTKSGTNEWHGGVFWQHRNTALNSNYYFNNLDGLPRDRLILNQGGGNVGGPIIKNKLFFFANYEEFQLPQTYDRTTTYLTDKARQGIYTYRDSTNTIREVNLLALANTANTTPNFLPATVRPYATTIDPTIGGILDGFKAGAAKSGITRERISTSADYNRLDLNFQSPGTNVRRFPTMRLDWNTTDKHHVEFVYNYQYYFSDPDGVNGQLPVVPGTGVVLGQPPTGSIKRNVFSGALALRSTLTPNLVNELRGTLGQGGNVLFSGEMSPGLFTPWRGYAFSFPYTGNPQTRQTQSRRHTPVWTFYDTVTYTKGEHSWAIGGAYTHIKSYQESYGSQIIPTATLGIATGDPINTGATSIFTTGANSLPNSTAAQRTEAWNLYAQLTGRVSGITRSASLNPETKKLEYAPFTELNSHNELGIFVQDAWRARPSLTLNYGLRWEMDFAPRNTNGIYSTAGYEAAFGVSGVGNLFKPGTYTTTSPGSFVLTDSKSVPYKTRYKDLAPSFGLAWSPNFSSSDMLKKVFGPSGQTVFRGGYSIAFVREGFNTFHSMWGLNEGPTVTLTVNPTANNTAAFVGPNGFTGAGSVLFRDSTLPQVAIPASTFPIAGALGVDFNEWDPNLRMGYTQSWSFGIQRELSKDMAFEVRYVGNHGTKLWRQLNLNEVNIFENGFLSEFKIAQENLRLARAINPASNNFGQQAAVAGTRAIPIIAAGLNTTNDATFATTITRGLAGSLANTIASSNVNMNRLIAANLVSSTLLSNGTRVSNHFYLNPVAGSAGSFLVTNGGHTTYNSLQVELRRRLSKGLLMDGSYTFGKSLTNMFASSSSVLSQPRSMRFPEYDKGLSPWDLRHAFKINGIYELPIGPGRYFLGSVKGPIGKVLEGWQIGGVARIQSGTSNLITSGRATLNTQDSGFILRNITRRELQSLVKIRKADNRIIFWLPQNIIDNTLAAFETGGKTLTDLKTNEPYLAPANVPGEFGERLFLQGPWQQRIDFNVLKRTKIKERYTLDFRAQFLNAFNLSNFFISGLADASSQGIATTFGQTRTAFRDITVSGTNDPGGRLIEFQLRLTF